MLLVFALGCSSAGHQFYDSAINDHNRAPASFELPKTIDEVNKLSPDVQEQAQADFLFLKSEIENNSGNSIEAIDALKNILAYDSSAVTVMQRLSVEYYKKAKLQDALYWAEKAYSLAPDRRDIGLLLAGLYTTTKKYTKAEDIYKKLIKKDSEDHEAKLYLGAVYTEEKKYALAIELFKKLTQVHGYSSKYLAHYYLARVYSEQKPHSYGPVRSELEKAIDLKPDFFEAIGMLGQIIQHQEGKEKSFQFYISHQQKKGPILKLAELLVQYFIVKGDYDKAYEQLEILDGSDAELVQVKLKMALILIDKKIYDKAISKLEEILSLVPESDKVRFYLSAVYEEKKEFKKAYDEYLKVQKYSDYFSESRLHAAHIARHIGKTADAIDLLNDVIEQKKADNMQIYFLLSELYESKNDNVNAIATLKKAENIFVKNEQLLYQLGVVQDRLGQKDDMLDTMKRVLEINSNNAQALNYLAYTWAERNEHLDVAEEYARKAVKNEPKDAFILDTLGWVLFKKGQTKEAAVVLEKAHRMMPEVGIILEHLGDVYSNLSLYDKAKSYFTKAIDAEQDNQRKKEIKNKLSQTEDKIKNSRVPAAIETSSNMNESP